MHVKRTLAGAAAALALVLAAPIAAQAQVVFTGDFETGTLSQWPLQQFCGTDIQTVTSPVSQGSYAARFNVPDTHAFPNCSATSGAPRAQLATSQILQEGGTYRTSFDVRFSQLPLRPAGSWYVVSQQFGAPFTNSPPVAIHVKNIGGVNRFTLEIAPNNTNTTQTIWQSPPINLNSWYSFRIDSRYGRTSQNGYVMLRFNGAYQQFPGGVYRLLTNTMDPDATEAYRFYLNSYFEDPSGPLTVQSFFDNARAERLL